MAHGPARSEASGSPLRFPLASAAGFLVASNLLAWTPEGQTAILRDALRTLPGTHASSWWGLRPALEEGVREPLATTPATDHFVTESGQGALRLAFRRELARAEKQWQRTPWSPEAARLVGRVAHFLSDANYPLNAAATDSAEPRYFADFARYADSARARFVLVERAPVVQTASVGEVLALVERALSRSREFYPAVGREYRRIDFGVGKLRFDDRCTAFAVAALSYHHAVADLRELLAAFSSRSRSPSARENADRPSAHLAAVD